MAKQKGDPRWPVYPDGLMNVPINGDENNLAAIAVEVERTRKTPKRYVQILKGHAANIAQGRYYGVVYFCVDQQAVDSLKALFKRIINEEKSHSPARKAVPCLVLRLFRASVRVRYQFDFCIRL